MAVQATQLLVRTGSSPKTPGNTTLVTEAGGLPLHITPLDMVESDHNPSTPHKDPTQKKKSGKLTSKRKLFHQNGQSIQIFNKAKKHSGPKTAVPSLTSRSTETGPRVHYPLTERQQLQYLLEVTAKDAKQDSGSSSSDDLSAVSNKIRKKDISRENQIDVRIRKKNERGETALHLAAIRGDLEDASALIKAGALVNTKDNAGWTPLHEACNYGNLRIVQELVWSGADVNSPGYEAITPLHDAVINDHIEVVKFLLENGSDPNLQTSQNYRTADLARSTAVLSLVSPEKTARDKDAVSSQEYEHHLQPSPFVDPNVHSQVATTDELHVNSSYSERSLYKDGFGPTKIMHINMKDDEVPIQSLENPQNKKMIVHFEEDCGIDSRKHSDRHNFHGQSFQSPYGFPRNAWLLDSEAEVQESKEKEELHARLSPPELYKHNGKLAEHLHQAHCHGVEATGIQASGHSEVVNKMVVMEMSPENIGQNHTKELVSSIACSNSQEEFLATETLVQMNSRCLSAKKPSTFVTPESEDDTVGPEKINECLDKAIIEISSYLETSQTLNAQQPFEKRDVSKVRLGLLINDKHVVEDRSLANNTPLRPTTLSPENVLGGDYSQENQQLAPIDQANNTEVETSESNAIHNDLTGNRGESLEQQLVVNFTKMKPRSEKKKDGSGVERNGKSGRRKRTSTRSSESSKYEMNENLVKEECTNHISNVTWRSELAKHRYSLANIPVCIPGYEDFLINNRIGPECEKNKDPTNANQLDKLISQHNTEKIKLRITLEQELVRLFRNDARKAAGYQVPLSACTVITYQMRLGATERVSSEEEQTVSFKCEVDKILNKFNRLKSDMLRRHNREIEVVTALGNLWNPKEARPSKDASSQIMRSEDFELLPAKFNEFYEDVLCATD